MNDDEKAQVKKRDVFKIAKKIQEIRSVPQFIFSDMITDSAVENISYKIIKFKDTPENKDVKEIDFIINSPGGLANASYKIIRTLRNHFDIVNIIVPFWAKSAATLLSLGGSKIVMDEFGEFGPLDVQLAKEKDDSPEVERESALDDLYTLKMLQEKAWSLYHGMFINLYQSESVQINKIELSKQVFDYVAKFYKPLMGQIDPYRLSVKARKLDIAEKYASRILTDYNDSSKIAKQYLVELLVHNCPDHGYVIDYNIIKKYLKNVFLTEDFAGKDYKKFIYEISRFFMINFDFKYTGFIKKEEKEKKKKEGVAEESKERKSEEIKK